MKLYFTFVVTFILLSLHIEAQTNMGITIGGNLAYLTGDKGSISNSDDNSIAPTKNLQKILKPGIHTGVFWDINTGYETFVQVGAIYSQQGSLYKVEQFDYNTDSLRLEKYTYSINNQLNYFKVPLVWKQYWGDWYTKLGVWGAYTIDKKSSYKGLHQFADASSLDTGTYASFAHFGRSYDFGMNFSLGIELPLNSKNNFFISANYSHGFLTFNPTAIRDEDKMYNRYFTLSTGIIFKSSKTYRRR